MSTDFAYKLCSNTDEYAIQDDTSAHALGFLFTKLPNAMLLQINYVFYCFVSFFFNEMCLI